MHPAFAYSLGGLPGHRHGRHGAWTGCATEAGGGFRHGRHQRHAAGPWGAAPFGGPFGRRRRMRRGDVRAALLVLLAEEPRNGYGLMREIEDRSRGAWRPSPGSVYPALALLEDEGLIRAEQVDGGKRFSLTDAGRAYVDEHRDRLGEPWAGLDAEVGEQRLALRALVGQLAAAAMQVAAAGDDRHVEEARRVLTDARRALYRILADDDA